jgi:hypothetical protein
MRPVAIIASASGTLVLDAADTVVWLDLPMRVWLPRLARTGRRITGREALWNGNRETLATAVWGRESLFGCALIQHRRRRREWPARMAAFPVTRLRTPVEVDRWIADV